MPDDVSLIENRPTATLVAELCQNHLGDRGLLGDLVWAAAENGADYVKIQALYSADLTFRSRFETGLLGSRGEELAIRRPFVDEVERIRGLDLSPADEEFFVDACLSAGVRPMVTVFTRGSIPRLSQLPFAAAKIASYDCASYPLLREVSEVWETIFVSTGGMFRREIERAAAQLRSSRLTLLHCLTLYPTPLEQVNLARLNWLRPLTGWVGFSDHTEVSRDGLLASKAALTLGADVIERHFTVLPATGTKDGPVSITPGKLRELREFADLSLFERRAHLDAEHSDWAALAGRQDVEPSPEELLNRDYYQGRVASQIAGRAVNNWEDIDLSVLACFPGPLSGYDGPAGLAARSTATSSQPADLLDHPTEPGPSGKDDADARV